MGSRRQSAKAMLTIEKNRNKLKKSNSGILRDDIKIILRKKQQTKTGGGSNRKLKTPTKKQNSIVSDEYGFA